MFRKLLGLLSDSAIYGASSLMSQLIGLFLLPLYMRYLTPADYGVIAMLGVVSMLFGPLAQLGMTNAIFRRFNVDKDAAARAIVLSTGLVSVFLTSSITFVIAYIFADQLASNIVGAPGATGLLRASLATATLASISMVPQTVLRAERRVKTAAAINVGKLLVSVIFTIWLVVYLELGIWGVVVGSLIGEAIFLLVQFAITVRAFLTIPNATAWKRMLMYGLPLVPHRLQGIGLAIFGQYMVNEMLGPAQAGIYYTATKFAVPVSFVVNAVQNSWVPYKFQIHSEDEQPANVFSTVVTYYVAGVLYLWIGVSLWGSQLVWWIAPETFHPAGWLVPLASLIPVATGFYFMLSTGVELGETTRTIPLVGAVAFGIVLTSVALLTPIIGPAGALLGTAIGPAAQAALICSIAQRRFAIPYDWGSILSLIAIALLTVAAGYIVLTMSPLPRIALTILISVFFPAAEFLILFRSSSERDRMQILWRKLAWRA